MSPKALTAGGTWSWQNPLPDGNSLRAISCPSTSTCFAGSSDGRIRATTNGGAIWVVQATGISTGINGISCANTTTCVAVGDFGKALRTTNGGANWNLAAVVNSGNFLAGVSCATTLICFADGALGSILMSGDGGGTWVAQSSGTLNHLFGISCPSASVCFAAGAAGAIGKSTDSGVTWTFQNQGWNFAAISCPTPTLCAAVGNSNSIGGVEVRSYDGSTWGGGNSAKVFFSAVSCTGATATQLRCFETGFDGGVYSQNGHASTGATGALYGISCPSQSTCFADGDYGTVVLTTNGGTGWTQQSPGLFLSYSAISCPSISTCTAVGGYGNLAAGTTDGGATWHSETAPFGSYLSVSCPSTTTCFAALYGLAIVRTTDGGATWASLNSTNNYLSVSCPSSAVCFAVGYGHVGTTTDGGATWSDQSLSPNFPLLTTVSCPSTTTCFATGHSWIYATTDGANWNVVATLGNFAVLNGISCPSTTTCFAVGPSKILATVNGGTSWTDETGGTTENLNSVSCPSTTTCFSVATSGAVLATTNGTTWAAQASATTTSMFGVSCPSTTICLAVGGVIIRSMDGGTTSWHVIGPSGTTSSIYGVSCPSSAICFAIGPGGVVVGTSNGGALWLPQTSGTNQNLSSISCPSTTTCFAVGQNGVTIATTDGGTTWVSQSSTAAQLVGVSCPGTTTCYAVASSGTFMKTANGTSWSALGAVGAATTLSAISCATANACFATDAGTPGQVFATTNGGTSWALSFNLSTDPQAGLNGPFAAISCPSTTTCYASGASGLIAATTDSGANWRTDNIPSSALMTGVSCPSVSTCYASANDSTMLYTTDYGGTWSVQTANVNVAYSGISCPTTTACFAVGANGVITTTTNGGAAWTTKLPSGPTTTVRGMSCTSASDCYAVAGNNILVTHNGGISWAANTLGTTDQLEALSCPAANTCFAVGWPGAIYFTGNGGTSWTYQPSSLSGSDQTLIGVSCSSAITCVAVGTQGTIISTSNGSTWAAESSGTKQVLTGVSCPNTFTCVAVGLGGLTMTRSGGSWQAYASGTTSNLHGVTCPGATTCYAVGDAGTVLYTPYRGGAWYGQAPSTIHDLYGVSCPKTTICLAVGNFGAAVVTLDGSSWSGLNTPTLNALRAVVFQDFNHAWVAGFGGTILANSGLTPGCGTASVAPDKASPQPVGTTVVLTASSSGCSSPIYEFFLQYPDGTWVMKQAFSGTATWSWDTTGYPAGTYNVHVWANQSGDSTATFEAVGALSYTLIVVPACATASLAPTNPSAPAGTTVALTASSTGCPNPQYEFWVGYPDGSWHLKQGWGGASFNWDTSGLVPGTYNVHVWANQIGHSTATFETFGSDTVTLTGCTTASISPPSVSQLTGSTVALTASSSGCPNPVYEFWVGYPDGTWHMKQGFGGATFNWNTSGLAAGTYSVHVWANQQGASTATWEANGASTVTLTSGACTSAALAPVNPSAAAGTVVVLTASSGGCANPQYEFWVQYPNGSWYLIQGWGGATFNWNTAGLGLGTYNVHVWANNIGDSTATWEAYGADTVTLTGCASAALSPSSGTATVGTPITFTASSTGCPNPVYEFWLEYPDGTWHLMQGFGAGTWTWTTTGLPKGNYVVHVWANQQGTGTSTFQTFGTATYTLT